jgi:hypothetical protein
VAGAAPAVLLIDEMARRAAAKGYRWADLSLTSADNPRTVQLAGHLGAVIYKRNRVYRTWLARASGRATCSWPWRRIWATGGSVSFSVENVCGACAVQMQFVAACQPAGDESAGY